MLDCLTNLVGLTDKDCDCFSASEPADFDTINASETGYYLTDEEHGLPLLEAVYSAIDCGDGTTVFSVLQKARAAALNSIYTDLQAAMLNHYDKAVRPFSGLVGQRKANGSRTVTKQTVGQMWRPNQIKDASFVVTGVWIGTTQAGNIDFKISSNDPDFTEYTQTFAYTTTGKFQYFELTAAQTLAFYSKNTNGYGNLADCGMQYAISYNLPSGAKPLDNVFSCCGNRNTEWKQYITAGGFETDDLATLVDSCTSTCNGYANGLSINGYLACDNLQWLCELEELNGYDLRDVVARAIQFSSTVFLTQHILDSSNINFWTSLSRESLYGKRNHAKAKFADYMNWIAENMPHGMTGCYKCKPSMIQRRSF